MSTLEFNDVSNDEVIEKYKKDAKFFVQLRIDVKRRYFDDIDFKEYEPQVQKLIDKHITTDGEILKITQPIDIFNKTEREDEVAKIVGKAAKADHIAARTAKGISIKMDEDPVFYKKLSQLIKETIEEYKQSRIDETQYLLKIQEIEARFLDGTQENVPAAIQDRKTAIAFYNFINEQLATYLIEKQKNAEIALAIETLIQEATQEGGQPIIDWKKNKDLEKQIVADIDDYFYNISLEMDTNIPFDTLDACIEEIIKIAKKQMD